MKTNHIVLGLALTAMAGCRPTLNSDTPSAGNLDFTNYVAVGNSITAGSADGSLYRSGQLNAYPSILASQFAKIGGGEFKVPLLPGESGWPIDYSSPDPNNWRRPRMVLGMATDCQNNTALGPTFFDGAPDTAGSGNSVALQGPFNNLGVPGMRVIDYVLTGYSIFNPYAARMYASPLESPMDQAFKINPTFFTLWLGNMDVLGYAVAGGEEHTNPLDPANISDVTSFTAAYDSLVKVMVRSGAKGVLVNIPEITSLPFFTTIPYNGLELDASQAAGLTAMHAGSGITFTAGANKFIIEDQSVSPHKYRQIREGEFILLSTPMDSMKCGGWGSVRPIPKQFVLTADEVAKVNQATTTFNSHILQRAIDYQLAFADMNAYMKTLTKGITFNGVRYNAEYLMGGAFSLDGVHPNPRGQALIANELIRVINSYYGSSVPTVDVNSYSGIKFP